VTTAGLASWLDGEPALDELGMTLRDVAGRGGRLMSAQKLREDVYRIALRSAHGRRLSVVAKCMSPPVAHRNQLALESWLPAAGLDAAAPRLAGVAAARGGRAVWHLYEDVGSVSLEGCAPTGPEVDAAIRLIATLHARLADHPILAECRLWGEDHSITYYENSVREAVTAVGAAVAAAGSGRDRDATRALLDRLERLAGEREQRARALAQIGGPETLLHGDLWLTNIAVVSQYGPGAPALALIDWDHVGPGPVSYDISRLVLRFPQAQRRRIVARYRAAAANLGIDLPADEDLHGLFVTAECARLASDAVITARVAAHDGSRWAFERLADIDVWYEHLQAPSAALTRTPA
jgi:thiamine kinase-like enzyme